MLVCGLGSFGHNHTAAKHSKPYAISRLSSGKDFPVCLDKRIEKCYGEKKGRDGKMHKKGRGLRPGLVSFSRDVRCCSLLLSASDIFSCFPPFGALAQLLGLSFDQTALSLT